MENTIKAIKEKQLQIAFKSKDNNDLMQHMGDIEIIGNLTLIKIGLRRKVNDKF